MSDASDTREPRQASAFAIPGETTAPVDPLDPVTLARVLLPVLREQLYPVLFATVSGAHLYGFASPDSDYDLRGAHLLPLREVLGLGTTCDTLELSEVREDVALDLVTHDLRKFVDLLSRPNGYALEQLYSPLIVHTTPAHSELKALAQSCITRRHSRHYLGFAASQWQLFERERPRRVKPLLYVFRVVLTGIHLMRTGAVEASLRVLNEDFRLPFLDELVARKLAGPEQATLGEADVDVYAAAYQRLRGDLEAAAATHGLPDEPSGREAISDFLVRTRLGAAC